MHREPMQVGQEVTILGVSISSALKHTSPCKAAYKKANTLLRFVARNFEYKEQEVTLSLYSSLVKRTLNMLLIPGLLITRKTLNRLTGPLRGFHD